jgi:hypothetical protein
VIASDVGLRAHRDPDDAVGLTDTGGDVLADPRAGRNRRHLLVGLLRQSLFGRLADERFVFSRAKKWQRTRSW